MDVFIQSEHVHLQWEDNFLIVSAGEKVSPVNLGKLNRIWLRPSTAISGELLQKLMENQVELIITSEEGAPLGTLSPWSNPIGARARKRQILFALSDIAQRLAAEWILKKQQAQLRVLKNHTYTPPREVIDKLDAIVLQNESLMGNDGPVSPGDYQEAYFSRLYFKALNMLLPAGFRFQSRSRQPARDPFNAALNYGYGILYGVLEGQVKRVGLDPYVGFWHKEKDGNPVLVYDLIEPFRPWVEAICLDLACQGLWASEDFVLTPEGGCWLGNPGKEKLIGRLFADEEHEKADALDLASKSAMMREVEALKNIIHQYPI